MNERILLIEDEEALRMTLCDRLESEGYQVECAADGAEGLKRALGEAFDIVVLDVMLPKKSGFDVCRDIRKSGRVMPIIMLTARGQTVDKVLGLKIGADDYLTKPFEMMELVARVEALLRRPRGAVAVDSAVHNFCGLRVDIKGTAVSRDGKPVPLSAREFRLLQYFLEHRGTTLSRSVLLKEVWGYSTETFTRTVDVHIASLRQKLESDPRQPMLILTVPGMGYKFAP
jgi:two-component system alkaline phosphatase synthesis response regulator PhoP